MLDVLKTLSATSVPNVLMGLGAVLILLAFVEKIGTHIELPAKRQRIAAITGAAFLFLGIGVTLAPHLSRSEQAAKSSTKFRKVQSSSPKTDKTRDIKTNKLASDKDIGANSGSTTEPLYIGALGNLMPDTKLIPKNLGFMNSRRLSPDNFFLDNIKDKGAAKRLLLRAGYEGIEQKWDANCLMEIPEGQVQHAIFQVDRTETAEDRKELWHQPVSPAPNSLGSGEWYEAFDSYFGDFAVKCGSAPAVMHWRSMRIGNVKVAAALFVNPRDKGSIWVTDLSESIVLSMAANVPGFEPIY